MTTHNIKINHPIGNLYRKNHVLILIHTLENKFILSQKQGFYPDGIYRFVGGGAQEGEDFLDAAVRELKEELLLDAEPSQMIELDRILTRAETSAGVLEMNTIVFAYQIQDASQCHPSDDINGIVELTLSEFEDLIERMNNLKDTFVAKDFSFEWSDWGHIYGFIHQKVLDKYLRNMDQ